MILTTPQLQGLLLLCGHDAYHDFFQPKSNVHWAGSLQKGSLFKKRRKTKKKRRTTKKKNKSSKTKAKKGGSKKKTVTGHFTFFFFLDCS